MALPVGTAAPDFSLKTSGPDGARFVTLSEHRGKDVVVLLFFPAAFTGVCTDEMCTVSGGLTGFAGAAVYGISVDSPFAQAAFAAKENITIPLLSDFSRSTIQAYDVVLPDLAGLGASAAQRAAFVIDKEGIIRFSEQTAAIKDLPDLEAVKACAASLA